MRHVGKGSSGNGRPVHEDLPKRGVVLVQQQHPRLALSMIFVGLGDRMRGEPGD